MKKKGKIFLGILAIFVILITFIGCFIVSDIINEEKIIEEINEVNELARKDNVDYQAIYKILDRRVIEKGDYLKVENASKTYLKESYQTVEGFTKLLNDPKFSQVLSIENYKNDGPNFYETKNYLTNARREFEGYRQKFNSLFTNDKIEEYIEKEHVSDKYEDFYEEKVMGDMDSYLDTSNFSEAMEKTAKTFDTYKNVIDMLSNTQSEWQIQGDQILFNSQDLLNRYNNYISNLN